MQEQPDAGYVQNFSLNSEGKWVAGSLKTGADFSSGHFSQFREGTSREMRDDTIFSQRQDYDVSEATGGGNRLLEDGHAEVLMARALSWSSKAQRTPS